MKLSMDKQMGFLNSKRLRDYPRLMLLACGAILAINLLFHNGWLGAQGQIIGIDYLLFYSTGLIYRNDPTSIYDYETQDNVQRTLIYPTTLPAVNPYFNPPYVALPHSWLTYLSFPNSLIVWSGLSFVFTILAGKILHPYLPESIKRSGFTSAQFLIVIFSFFPFIEGLIAGQNHSLTFLLISLIVIFSISERWYLAGIAAGLLLYKPQFILGFLIIWLFGKKISALISFGIVAVVWIGYFILSNGTSLFNDYLIVSSMLLKLPYDEGFPTYLLVTPYGFLASLLHQSLWILVYRFSQVILIITSAILARQAWLTRNIKGDKTAFLYGLAILWPLIATPYALLHDLLILIPFFVIFSIINPSKKLILATAAVYIGGLILPLAGYVTQLAMPAFITIGITVFYIRTLIKLHNRQITLNDEYRLGREI